MHCEGIHDAPLSRFSVFEALRCSEHVHGFSLDSVLLRTTTHSVLRIKIPKIISVTWVIFLETTAGKNLFYIWFFEFWHIKFEIVGLMALPNLDIKVMKNSRDIIKILVIETVVTFTSHDLAVTVDCTQFRFKSLRWVKPLNDWNEIQYFSPLKKLWKILSSFFILAIFVTPSGDTKLTF